MPDQEGVDDKGGTMRLGAYPCKVAEGTLAREAYGEELVYERHRHRFEVNNAYRAQLQEAGLVISGVSPDERLVEMVELPEDVHPWFVASQAHPEFKSRPNNPAPLFREFTRPSAVAPSTMPPARGSGASAHQLPQQIAQVCVLDAADDERAEHHARVQAGKPQVRRPEPADLDYAAH